MTGPFRMFRLIRPIGAGAVLGLACAGLSNAQPSPPPGPAAPAPPSTPAPAPGPDAAGLPAGAPPPEEAPPEALAPPPSVTPPPVQTAAPPSAPAAPEKPPEPIKRARSNVAILQALDKVTAQSMRFEAEVGKPVRYKNLVFTVKACERAAPDEPMDDSIAYLTIESQPKAAPGKPTPAPRQVFRGWMYASSPGLNPLEHPAYDAWVITCKAPAPALIPAAAPAPPRAAAKPKPAPAAAPPAPVTTPAPAPKT
jgi:hypothetical protein